jgi:hypothetical protein
VTMATTTTAVAQTSAGPSVFLRALVFAGRIFLGFTFLYAAYAKLHFENQWHFGDYYFFFAMAIDSYHMVPAWGVEFLGRFLPWLEMVLGASLISGVGLRWVGTATSALLLVFIGAMLRAKLLGLEINCGCFGNNEKLGTATLLRDSSFLLVALLTTLGAFLIEKRKVAVSS